MTPYNITPYLRYSVQRKCPASGWKINTRTIPDHEFVLITGGSGQITIDGKVYAAKSGMLFYFHPNLPHALESCDDNPLCFFGLHFSFAHVQYMNSEWTIESGNGNLPLTTVMEIKYYLRLEKLMKSIHDYWKGKATGYELICNSLFMQLLYHLLDNFKVDNFNYSSRLKIEKVIDYIQKNMETKLSVRQLANLVQLSPDYLSSIFKNFTGYTLIQYINKCRVDTAKLIFIEENKKVKEVAAFLGFKDEFYFSRVFKKIEGISPLEFLEKST